VGLNHPQPERLGALVRAAGAGRKIRGLRLHSGWLNFWFHCLDLGQSLLLLLLPPPPLRWQKVPRFLRLSALCYR
jgi:hypothetical protein